MSRVLSLLICLVQASATLSACPPFSLPVKNETALVANLPDPFIFQSGQKVTTKADWTCRRTELKLLMQHFEFGTLPPAPPILVPNLTAEGKLTIDIEVENGKKTSFATTVRLPNTTLPGPFPAVIPLGGVSVPIDTSTTATIILNQDELAHQQGEGSRGRGKFYDIHGSSHSAGSLIAYTWGISRIIDALELLGPSTTHIDATRLAITGCSRNAKAALVAGAFEDRIALTIPQEAGPGATVPWRTYEWQCRSKCTQIQRHPIWETHTWFRRDFPGTASRQLERLPYDKHELIGLVAPRGLYIPDNNIDWLDPQSTALGSEAGRKVFEALGVRAHMGLGLEERSHNHCQFPEEQRADLEGFVGKFLFGREMAGEVWRLGVSRSLMGRYVDWKVPVLL